jgi:hypothetical protein
MAIPDLTSDLRDDMPESEHEVDSRHDASPGDAPEQPAPLLGCLYCHAENATELVEGRKILGFGAGLPSLTCKNCGSVALFEHEPGAQRWRIRYKKVNRMPRYYYVMLHLGAGGWLRDDDALEISRVGFIQRLRVGQASRGELEWLHPAPLSPPPPLMSPDENVYLAVDPVSLMQNTQNRADATTLDAGAFYVTDKKVHLLGHRRDWSHRFSDIHDVKHTDANWQVHVGAAGQFYQGANHPGQIDAQLFTAVICALMGNR